MATHTNYVGRVESEQDEGAPPIFLAILESWTEDGREETLRVETHDKEAAQNLVAFWQTGGAPMLLAMRGAVWANDVPF